MNVNVEKASFELNSVRNQYFAVITANLLMLGNGCALGWPTQAMPKLESADTPLEAPLSSDEISWIVAINCIGSLLSSMSYGFIISVIGSKRALMSATVFLILFWLLIHFGTNFYWILSARLISGVTSGAVYLALVLFSAEVANDSIRGSLTSLSMLSWNIGALIAYILGAFVEYHIIPYICISMPVIFAVIFIMLPNTPRFYLARGEVQRAEEALKFYKGYKGKDPMEDDAIAAELNRLRTVENEQKTSETLQISDFCNKKAMKGMFIGVAMNTISYFTAYYTLTNYATKIFQQTDSTLFSPYIATILMAVALTLGSLLTTFLADVLGRRVLIIISLAGSVVGLLAMALHYYLYLVGYDLSSFKWVPVLSLSFVIFIAAAGITPLATVCSVENLPPKIRNVGMSIVGFIAYLILFAFLKVFPLTMELFDLHGCMIIFAVLSTLGIIFVAFVLEETSGQSLDDVGYDEHVKFERARARSLSFEIKEVLIQNQDD